MLYHSRSAVAITDRGRYLLNPFTIITCLAQPTSVFTNCAILQSIATATTGNTFNSILALATASYLSMYPILLAPPLALLNYDRLLRHGRSIQPARFYISYTTGLFTAVGSLLVLSYLITGGSWEFISSTYGTQLMLSDLTPNMGLWWYFFIEMFDSFRDFFLGVFWLHMASYTGGLTIRIR